MEKRGSQGLFIIILLLNNAGLLLNVSMPIKMVACTREGGGPIEEEADASGSLPAWIRQHSILILIFVLSI